VSQSSDQTKLTVSQSSDQKKVTVSQSSDQTKLSVPVLRSDKVNAYSGEIYK